MRIRGIAVFIASVLLFSCSMGRMPKNLKPEEQEFFSYVRYIITGEERKIFLNLPPSERPRFIEEFWKRRDLDPETEVNEYKNEYLKRIEEAKHLFPEGGTSGWLTDRGRIYVLLGPPEQRESYPRGYSFYGVPMEIWRYGFYEMFFFDRRWNGNFELDAQNAMMIADINTAQMNLRARVEKGATEGAAMSNFKIDFRLIGDRSQLVVISLPYRDIWFTSEKEKFKADMEAAWEVYDADDQRIQEGSKSASLDWTQKELKEHTGQEFSIEFPLELAPGDYQIAVTLKNLTSNNEVRKRIKLTI
jgi:GWxTD domain-containing protein